MEAKKVTINIVSERGDDKVVLPVLQAVERIKTEVKSNGKWLYLDGAFTSADAITTSDLERAQDITLGDTLMGGQ